jgi:hypothetical protein
VRIVAFLLALLFLVGCDPCGNTVVSSSVSPDGKFEATVFIRDCGATMDYSPQVDLRPKGKPLRNTGNVFVGKGDAQIKIQWLSSTQLLIRSDCRLYKASTNYEGIAILHEKTN